MSPQSLIARNSDLFGVVALVLALLVPVLTALSLGADLWVLTLVVLLAAFVLSLMVE